MGREARLPRASTVAANQAHDFRRILSTVQKRPATGNIPLSRIVVPAVTMSAPASFQQQLVELIPRLRRFARGLTRSAADADDVAQAAIERALMHQETWRPGTRLDSWVYRIAQNLWRDELRAHRRRAESLDAAQVGGEDGRESFVRHIEVGEVAASFHQLPEEQRLVLTLVVSADDYLYVARTLRDNPDLHFEQLIDLCGVDYSAYAEGTAGAWQGKRFAVVVSFAGERKSGRREAGDDGCQPCTGQQ